MTIISRNHTINRRTLRFAVLGAFAFLSMTVAAHAQSMRPLQAPRSNVTEFRGYAFVKAGLEDDIWRLASDGHATMVYLRRGGRRECDESGGCQGSDSGIWSRDMRQICVRWQTRSELSGCYTIIPKSGIHVRLVGPVTFEGTLEAG